MLHKLSDQISASERTSHRTEPSMLHLLAIAAGMLGLATVTGCATAATVGEYPNQQKVIGKSKAEVLACAGKPVKEQTRNDVVLLQYYREAPILEESQPVGKGSMSTNRHGCWATVVLTDDRVTDVRYRFAPPSMDASNDCEAIFDPCAP
ncbi:conserved exported hypothetical protein [Nitrospira lenta]|uniref:Uncharacterized protein n=2 Tax=Nitrospira lenta TaxID=1436998 RepID=A0A330LHE3_9BACT|nr:conserved exported hypothetical protein [Nitrospira lenta]